MFFFYKGNFNVNRNSHRGRNVLKFESDYDFEQANNKFEELRLQLSKLKVGEEQKTPQVCVTNINFEDFLVCIIQTKHIYYNIL